MQNKRNGNHKITQITNNNNKGPFCRTKQACVQRKGQFGPKQRQGRGVVLYHLG